VARRLGLRLRVNRTAATCDTRAAPVAAGNVNLTLKDLLALSHKALRTMDIGQMNFLTAEDLPGAAQLNVQKSIAELARWSDRVRSETERYFDRT
jgi:hypothetical protein